MVAGRSLWSSIDHAEGAVVRRRFRRFGLVARGALVLMPVCILTAISLLGQQEADKRGQQENLDSRRAAVELEECLTALVALEDNWVEAVSVLHDRVQVLLHAVERAADQPEERELSAQLRSGFTSYLARWHGLPPAGGAAHDPARQEVTRALKAEVLRPCQELEGYNSRRINESAAIHGRVLGQLAWSMVCIGGLAGLVLGYEVARVLSRSLLGRLSQVPDSTDTTDASASKFVADVDGILATPSDRSGTARAALDPKDAEQLRTEQMAAVSQLAAGVGHELRNPLTSVKLLIQTGLEDGTLTTDDLRVIDGEVRRMERSLQTFLEFARPPKADRRPTPLVPLVREVAESLRGRSEKQRVGLQLDVLAAGMTVRGDRDQLQQVLIHLMRNALDAMPAGGCLMVTVRIDDPSWVEVEVTDTGPGIPPALLPRLFLPFASSKDIGLGLGLAICKRIVEDHDGTLRAANRLGGGTRFVITLPAEPTHASPVGR